MAKKHQEEEHGESAPMWIVSFADLVTLMLSFFVILAAGNNQSSATDPEFAKLVSALKAAFNDVEPSAQASVDPQSDFRDLVNKLMALQTPQTASTSKKSGDSEAKSVEGRYVRATRIREGLELTMGGPVFFEAFSARPTAKGEEQLREVVDIVRGHRNVIEIRGHVGETPWPVGWTYDDIMKLAYDRADYVGHVLRRGGIDKRAIRLVAVGSSESVRPSSLNPDAELNNRRVQIVVRESLIDDYGTEPMPKIDLEPEPAQPSPGPPASRPAKQWDVPGPFAN